MKQILLILLVFSATLANGQKVRINQLTEMIEYSENDFDTHATKKGFRLLKIVDSKYSENCKRSVYTYGNVTNGFSEFFLCYTSCKNDNRIIEYQFYESKQYAAFKNQLQNAGYEYDTTRIREDGTKSVYYKKKNGLEFVLITATNGKNPLGETITLYKIETYKENNEVTP